MIRINVKDTGITVSGHAQRLPGASPGHNIICAGVSALTLTLIEGLREVAGHRDPGERQTGQHCHQLAESE